MLTFASSIVCPKKIIDFIFSDVIQDTFLVLNHMCLLFKHFISISRDSNMFLFLRFFRNLQKLYTIKQKISQESERKKELFHKIWQKIENKLQPYKLQWDRGWVTLFVKLLQFLFCSVDIMFAIISMIYILLVVFYLFLVNYMFRVGGGDAGARCRVCLELTVKTSK